ncbi:lipopolysaccharide heptosyltransferase RfaC [Candidatus Curculioniphilus buchneri]|uniref:lipopolysaccharide heptosyltransferase RfaC n=1 Tax=Candidatus Curculioniphilus buchneri TaxID=690594 RepID=UPI00376F002D
MNVLIIKISSMGDILHTLPALTDAMNMLVNIRFDWVIEENFAQIPTWHPAVCQVFPVALRRWRYNWFNTETIQELFNFTFQLQKKKYEIIIDAQGLIKSAALVAFVHGEKHGLDYKSAREPLASFFYNQRHTVAKQQHAIKRIRQLFSNSLSYILSDNLIDYAITHYFKSKLISKNPYLIFLHSTTHIRKHWPESHWRLLIAFTNESGYRIKLPWGSNDEYQRSYRLAQGYSHVEILLSHSLMQIAEQLIGATAIVSVDTGISHLAAALNCPNLTLYGPTDPNLIGVHGRYQKILRAKDGNMKNLTAVSVWQALQTILTSK